MIQPRFLEEHPRIRNPRRARGATDARVRRNSRARTIGLWRFSAVLIAASALLLGYVMLTSNLTGMAYAVSKSNLEKSSLQAQTSRLDDRISALESVDRLASIATKLGMREPQQYAVVRLPQTVAPDRHVALLTTIAGFFGASSAHAPTRKVR